MSEPILQTEALTKQYGARTAVAGLQGESLGGRPVYVMPSSSGLNAHSSVADLADHLRAALALV